MADLGGHTLGETPEPLASDAPRSYNQPSESNEGIAAR